ncbi:MAG: tRNA (N6-threonylcarbamoyladenosine(37)-N6)-methyltransferase TrmO [Lentisphaeria bacterium]|nr:tRNA (N6-threonylcarbamoyladenosine(37)-N6)-methyltransferase TrmO [Lentisphaeria bacterium]
MKYEFEPIGFVRSTVRYPQEAPRQGVLTDHEAVVELEKGRSFEEALADLEGVERIWIVFVFHLVRHWKPKVRPPVDGDGKKRGVFSTRSPHRPNPVGITAARLKGVDGLRLRVSEIDLLDGTPVLDIKPYIPFADAFPDARAGWRDRIESPRTQVVLSDAAAAKADFILKRGGPDIGEFCRTQLGTRLPDPARMRLSSCGASGAAAIAFRTWRIHFSREEDRITVGDILSGYAPEELLPGADDPVGDKELHREFRRTIREFFQKNY